MKNPAYFGEEGRESRITGWEFNLDLPYDSPRYTIGESVQYSRLGSIEDSLEALTYKGQTYTGGGGSGVYVIRTNDTTPASDSNVFSALKSLATFLRKDRADTAHGLITLERGAEFGVYAPGCTASTGTVCNASPSALVTLLGRRPMRRRSDDDVLALARSSSVRPMRIKAIMTLDDSK